jgi:hypothetical protein
MIVAEGMAKRKEADGAFGFLSKLQTLAAWIVANARTHNADLCNLAFFGSFQ